MPELALDSLIQEIETGLKNEQHRLNDAIMAQAFFDYEGKRFMQVFLKDAETPFDYVERPYRASGLTREIVEILTEHLYGPGPSRTWTEATGNEFLQRVYADNHIDAIMSRADQLSTLADVAAIQVDAGEGVFAKCPITLRLWGADEFHAWTLPRDRRRVGAVVTIDRYDVSTTYTLWTRDEVLTFQTRKAELFMGGRVAKLIDRQPNTYGRIPFEFIHYDLPVSSFWQTGIGDYLVQAEIRLNDRLSRLDESINKHLNPTPVAENVPDDFQLILEANRFIKLNANRHQFGKGGFEPGEKPNLYYLTAPIDIAGAWDDLARMLNQYLEATRTPVSAVRMDQSGVASGISLVVEQAPLLTRARRRRPAFSVYEGGLARCILECAGAHYGRRELLAAASAGNLTLGWPQPSIPIPTPDRLELVIGEVKAGFKSVIMAVQEWYGVSRVQAVDLLRQMRADREDLATIDPDLAGASMAGDTDSDEDDGDGPPPQAVTDDPNGDAEFVQMITDL